MSTILVIEDDELVRMSMAESLRLENFHVLAAGTGEEGLSLAREKHPDLVLCDIVMPLIDGYDVLQELRRDPTTTSIPLIFVTGRTAPEIQRCGMALGADDFLLKPFDHDELLLVVRARLRRKRATEKAFQHQFAAKLVATQERERHQFARILQKDVSETLASLKMMLTVGKSLPVNTRQNTIDEVLRIIESKLDQVELITHDLNPAMLDHLGLLPVLLWQIERFINQTGIAVHFEHQNLESVTQAEVKLAVYRILQEALQNVVQHAETRHAIVAIWVEEGGLYIEVADEGVGFRPETVLRNRRTSGLLRIQERTVALNGEFAMMSEPGSGTTIKIWLPLANVDPSSKGFDLELDAIIQQRIRTARADVVPKLLEGDIYHLPDASDPHDVAHVRVALAEEFDIVRRGLRELINNADDMRVVGETATLSDVPKLVSDLRPDVLVIDLNTGREIPTAMLQEIVTTNAQTRVLALSGSKDETLVLETFKSGATGFVLRASSADEIVEAVREINAGRKFVSAYIPANLLTGYIDVDVTPSNPLDGITEQEIEIIQLLATGYNTAEIAGELSIGIHTAEAACSTLLAKLGINTRRELLRFARINGLLH